MKRFWMLIPLLLLTLNLLPSEQAVARAAYFSPNLTAVELITKVNELRATKNLPPFKTNPILMTIAQAQADHIATAGVMTHFNANGTPPFQRAIQAGYPVAGDLSQGGLFAENIGSGGTELTVSDIISTWQNDTKNLETMLSTELKDVGAGMTVADSMTYYVLDAGTSPTVSATPSTPVNKKPPVGTQNIAAVTSTPLEDGTIYHIVKANEGLWNIALNYNTTIENLKLLNRLQSNDIYEGQKLLIKKPEVKLTATPTILPSATFGIPTSTATSPVTPTALPTATPPPVSPTSRESGGTVVGIIVLAALIAAGVGSWLGKKKSKSESQKDDSNSQTENPGAEK
jgi:LysM repeat protein